SMDNEMPPNKPTILPTLKNGVTIAFNDYDIEGKPLWLIYDPGRNKFFLIGWLEYEILERWKMGDINKILKSVNTETTLDIEEQDIISVADFLKRNYLIQQSGYEIGKIADDQ